MIILLSIIFNLNVFTYQNEPANFDFKKKEIFIYLNDPHCHQCIDNLAKLFKNESVNIIYSLQNLEDYRTKASIFSKIDKMFLKKELYFANSKIEKLNSGSPSPFIEIIFNNKSKIYNYDDIFNTELSNSIKDNVKSDLKNIFGFNIQ